MSHTTIKLLVATCILHAIISDCVLIVHGDITVERQEKKLIENMFTDPGESPSEEKKSIPICSNNKCELKLRLHYRKRSLEGMAIFKAEHRTLIGEATVTYKNLENGLNITFGFRITIQYLEGEESIVKLSAIYGSNGNITTNGVNVQRLLIPAICSPDLTQVPLFRLCLKLTQVTFYKHSTKICLTIRIQFSIIGLLNLYTKCMNITSSTAIHEAKTIMTKSTTLEKSPEKQQSSSQKPTLSEDKDAKCIKIAEGGCSEKEQSGVTEAKGDPSKDKKQSTSSDVKDNKAKVNPPEDNEIATSADEIATDFIVPIEKLGFF